MYTDPPKHVQEYLDNIKELFAYCQKHAGGVSFDASKCTRLKDAAHPFERCFPWQTAYSSQLILELPHSQNMTNLNHLESLYDTLLIEELNGLKLPNWTHQVYPVQLYSPAARNLALLVETDFMKRIKGGKFVG